ncbi:hypothetical protein BRADI_5g16026v3 [Brachypodium distachyon]|uniref:TTF-type domain-containing protein n=1 Tax=Brachypodium distachyon TaxID=15368 RepID=A0A0Q3IC06_BRADI|nr:hypothetical protein BRADI_5g16026v3 [Brachypodium distachyon]
MSSDEDDDMFNPDEIESDPALRIQIEDYHSDVQDRVRRAYLLKGPTQPNLPHFERTNFGSKTRAFSKTWYKKYDWIEYSKDRNVAFCFYCFLLDWKHAYKALPGHVGGVGSAHNKARLHCDDFRNQNQSVSTNLARATEESKQLYKSRLHSSLGCARYLIFQGLSFRGHDESSTSLNKGNFLEMIDWHKINDEKVRDAFDRAGRNCKMLSPEIQKDLSKCCTQEVTEVIMREIGDRKFSVLIDESRDISVKEQMAVMLRYVSSKGKVVERFLSLYHVKETTSMTLKEALDAILDHYNFTIHRLRGQEYDGASNMRGEFNGLQRKILDENPYALYVHCFSHRLQLVVVSVASCCSSFMICLIIFVLREVNDERRGPSQAAGLIELMESFKFAFVLHLMIKLLAITNEFSQVLQIKDINIVNAIELVHDLKARLASMRKGGWEGFFDEVQHFCQAKGIPVPNMEERIPVRGRSRLDGMTYTNLHFYRVEIFYVAIDKICTEMNHRLNEEFSEIIVSFSCLTPKNSFSMFDVDKLASLAEIYRTDFSNDDRTTIRDQLETYILHVRRHAAFSSLTDLESLAIKMVETENHLVFPLVYKLIELALLLLVSTASVERAFSAMKIIKSKLHSRMANEWFNDLMICYTEREIFKQLDDDLIVK